ncbi:aldehyde dehydrogenase family protein [Sagittula stellata]|uniref:Phenylacetaldehyde dehydrogenase n=1 Tax=Sagittula stellata (strain ATCC 700073 / DSM 11524 / E-37) TaxID=388399 RepID=A3K7A8_SAGS3|nr:aldehyde dehydrogenase family protein [Sagittula stellata]EBA06867.1 phenylacetaldehyde dehydrogenase [Sagittula stellata E-37]
MKIGAPDKAPSSIAAAVTDFLKAPKMLIGGTSCDGEAGSFDVFNPADGTVLASVPEASEADVDRAVAAAGATMAGTWGSMSGAGRTGLMLKLADLIEENGEELAQLETLENGKSIMMSRLIEVMSSAEYIRYMAGWATKIRGETLDVSIAIPPGTQYTAFTRKEPVGVVAAITPWNFPLNMAVWKIAPALAAGCTVVLKPAEETPLTSLRLVELVREAGFPDGVVNVVTGGGAVGAALVRHPGVNKITFTGSTETGKKIGVQAMQDVKPVTLELGGKAPMVMFDDMDLSLLGPAAGIGIFLNAGQTCCAGARLFIQRGIYKEAVSVLKNIVSSLPIGPGMDPANQINPLVSAKHHAHVKGAIDKGIEDGATPLLSGEAPDAGYFVAPQLFEGAGAQSALMQDEVFGPVATITPFDTEDEVIAMANDVRYGLGASLWSRDINRVMRLVPKVQAGTVWINSHNIPDQNMPFGGFKQSGIGREHGSGALDNFLETKSVCVAYS